MKQVIIYTLLNTGNIYPFLFIEKRIRSVALRGFIPASTVLLPATDCNHTMKDTHI